MYIVGGTGLPAKSGNDANSIEKLTKPSNGWPWIIFDENDSDGDASDTIFAVAELDSANRQKSAAMTTNLYFLSGQLFTLESIFFTRESDVQPNIFL